MENVFVVHRRPFGNTLRVERDLSTLPRTATTHFRDSTEDITKIVWKVPLENLRLA
jgi:hypothetical protein